MKKCPFCGADIEESARFCLYCMQSLTEKEQLLPHQKKKPQCLMIIAAIVMTLLLLAVVWLSRQSTSGNGKPSDTLSVTKSAHTPATAVTENYIEATCTQTGFYDEVVYCSECQEEISRTQKTLDKKPHDYNQKVTTTEHLKTKATCTDSAAYYYSCICGAKGTATFADGEANEHTYDQKNTATKYLKSPATETDSAVYYYSCECGVKGTTTFTDGAPLPHIHNFNQTVATSEYLKTSATCENKAVYYYSCRCGEAGTETFISGNLADHTPDKAKEENKVDSTCAEEGSYDEVVYCSVCNIELSRSENTIDKKTTHTEGNTVTENYVDSTFEEKGSYDEVVYCTVCGKELSRTTSTIPEKNHTPAEAVIENKIDSTCKDEGSYDEVVYCSICEVELRRTSQTIEKKTTHTHASPVQENFVDSTCKIEGSYAEVIFCSVCDIELSRETKTVVRKTTHTEEEAVTENFIDSTCKDEGSYDEVVYCSVCDFEIRRTEKTIDKKTIHTESEAVQESFVDSTCSKLGSYDMVVYCSVCNGELSRIKNTIDKKTHVLGDWVVDKAATCMTTGTRHNSCSVCDEYVYENYSDPDAHYATVAWTLDNTHHWHKCSNSGCTAVVEKTAHKITDGFCADCGVRNVDSVTYTRDGNYIYFGEYPQSLKADDVTITANMNVRGYYVGSDGCYYTKVYAEPRYNNYTFQSGASMTRGYYYFKVEPIRWRILSEDGDTALILCDSILTNKAYNEQRTSTYEQSAIRAWLNDQFYNGTFNEFQKDLINAVLVDNDFGEITNDKVFLLNHEDIINANYGFASSDSTCDTARRMIVNDYARATGADMSTSSSYYGFGTWLLGEAEFGSYSDTMNVLLVGEDGRADYCSIMTGDCWGVVPALQIRLSDREYHVDTTGLMYRVNEDGTTCTITGVGTCSETEIVIPDEIDDMKVTSIGDSAFWGCKNLTSITIPDSVMSIGKAAFGHCKNLTSIIIPASVENIGERAFDYCTGLASVIVEENSKLTSIGSFAFNHCPRLTSITIPSSVTSIGEQAFHYYYSNGCNVYITDLVAWCGICFGDYEANPLHRGRLYLNGQLVGYLVIPTGVTSIGDYAFYGCDYLYSVTISDSVTTIGKKAFSSCRYITSVNFGETSQLTAIGESAFERCYNLTSITIPASITSIGDGAFNNCSRLVSINYCGSNKQWQAINKGTDWDKNTGAYFIIYNYKEQ